MLVCTTRFHFVGGGGAGLGKAGHSRLYGEDIEASDESRASRTLFNVLAFEKEEKGGRKKKKGSVIRSLCLFPF